MPARVDDDIVPLLDRMPESIDVEQVDAAAEEAIFGFGLASIRTGTVPRVRSPSLDCQVIDLRSSTSTVRRRTNTIPGSGTFTV